MPADLDLPDYEGRAVAENCRRIVNLNKVFDSTDVYQKEKTNDSS